MSKRGRMKAGGKMPKWLVEFQHTAQYADHRDKVERFFIHKKALSQESATEIAKSIVGQKVRLGVFDVTVEKTRISGPEGQVIYL